MKDLSQCKATLVVLAYNHEHFVRSALSAAFAQTYQPLEIIISDDASSDSTWQIIQEVCDDYHGAHEVVIRRNEKNLGINKHFNVLMSLVSGEYIAIAAADDVMSPDRVAKSVNFLKQSQNIGMHSNAKMIDEEGKLIREAMNQDDFTPPNSWEEMLKQGASRVTGATMAWHRSVTDVFGSIPDTPLGEDAFIPFRCSLLGGMGYYDAPLVSYRSHSENVSFWKALEKGNRSDIGKSHFNHRARALECWMEDILIALKNGYLSQKSYDKARLMCEQQILRLRFLEESMQMPLLKAVIFLQNRLGGNMIFSKSFHQTMDEYLLFKYSNLYRLFNIKAIIRRNILRLLRC